MHDGHDHGPIGPVTPLPDSPVYGAYLIDGPTPIANYGYQPTTVTVKDGNWFDPSVWSAGVPKITSVIQIDHTVKIAGVSVNGDLNGDGKVDVNDFRYAETLEEFKQVRDVLFGLVVPSAGNAVAQSGLISPKGCLEISPGSSLSIGTLQVLGCFELYGGDLIFLDQPFDYIKDAMQWGHGFIGFSGSVVTTQGGRVFSQNKNGVRGHFAILHGCKCFTKGTEYFDLGRTKIGTLDNTQLMPDGITAKHVGTNQMARYGGPHYHHCYGSQIPSDDPQFIVENCYIHDGTKWGVTVHQSHFGLVEGNLIERCGGAGIAFEDGNEFGNMCRGNIIRDIFGDGKGQQGHNNGENVKDVGDGTPGSPYRTLGSHGNEGAGIWARGAANDFIDNEIYNCEVGSSKWNRFNDGRKRPLQKGDTPDKYVDLVAGSQFDFLDSGTKVRGCKLAAQIQGMVGVHRIIGLDIAECENGLDTSYNGTLAISDSNIFGKGVGFPMQPGFTGKFALENNRVFNWKSPVILDNEFSIKGGEYDSVAIRFKHVATGQRIFTIEDAKIARLSRTLGDLNKNRDYGCEDIVLILNHNGVAGDNFELFFSEQAEGYIPKNLADGNPRRVTPEPGLTQKQLGDKYAYWFGGKPIPANAVTRPGVAGFCAPIPDDLTPPKIIERTVTTTADSITVVAKTDKPTRIRTEYKAGTAKVGGDIQLYTWPPLVLPSADFKTQHTVTITGLKPKTAYSIRQPAIDAGWNLGGDNAYAGSNYKAVTAITK